MDPETIRTKDEKTGINYGFILTDDSEIWQGKSKYFTYCLDNDLSKPSPEGKKTYCFGHDWFNGKAPYPVFRVSDGAFVWPEKYAPTANNKWLEDLITEK